MKCLLNDCPNIIPSHRKKTARYCSYFCYYEAKKQRSCQQYARLKSPYNELKRLEIILGHLYSIQQLKKTINTDDLIAYKFNFGIATGDHLDDDKKICKVIGKYAYRFDSSKNVIIWKLK